MPDSRKTTDRAAPRLRPGQTTLLEPDVAEVEAPVDTGGLSRFTDEFGPTDARGRTERSKIRFRSYPRTEPPPCFAEEIIDVFRRHEHAISTEAGRELTSAEVLGALHEELQKLGFEVTSGERKADKIERPVFFGDYGRPTLTLQVDAYHAEWRCEVEIEVRPTTLGTAIYRNLVQAMVMVDVDTLVIAVPNVYPFGKDDNGISALDYEKAVSLAETLYGHSRFRLPYSLIVLGY